MHTGSTQVNLPAVEVRDFVFGQFQFANRTVVGIGYQNPVAIDGDPKRMLQTCLAEVTVDPSEVEQSGADQRQQSADRPRA